MTSLLEQVRQPQLSAKRLQVLAAHDATTIRAAVAANPSTPLVSLLQLLGEFPEVVLANPTMLLHQLVDPALFLKADPELQAAWARHPATPSWLLAQMGDSDSDEVRASLAMHPQAPAEVVERLAFPREFGNRSADPRPEAMCHPGLPPGLLFDVAMAFAQRDDFDYEYEVTPPAHVVALLLAPVEQDEWFNDATEEPCLDAIWSASLSLDSDGDVADDEGFASLTYRDPESNSHVLVGSGDGVIAGPHGRDDEPDDDRDDDDGAYRVLPRAGIAGDDEASIWGASTDELVCHPGAPWTLVRRAWHRTDSALEDALGRPDVPVEQLTWLTLASEPRVRLAVARHRRTPSSCLAALARDIEPMVRLHVARHRSTPATVLTTLATDESATIRRAVAANPSTLPVVRGWLASDRRASVRKAAEGKLNELYGNDDEEDSGENEGLAGAVP